MNWSWKLALLCAVLLSTAIASNNCSCAPPEEFDEARMTRKELGNHGWALLHTIAAYFPREPSDSIIDHAHLFLQYLGEIFPCKECGEHFVELLKEKPPVFKTREEFMVYMCDLHNTVNSRLGHPVFDCSISNLMDRWGGDADCACEDSFLQPTEQP